MLNNILNLSKQSFNNRNSVFFDEKGEEVTNYISFLNDSIASRYIILASR